MDVSGTECDPPPRCPSPLVRGRLSRAVSSQVLPRNERGGDGRDEDPKALPETKPVPAALQQERLRARLEGKHVAATHSSATAVLTSSLMHSSTPRLQVITSTISVCRRWACGYGDHVAGDSLRPRPDCLFVRRQSHRGCPDDRNGKVRPFV